METAGGEPGGANMILPVIIKTSPYAKTIATHRGAHSSSGAVRGATPRKAKGVSRSPSQVPSCASAPAHPTRQAGERLPTTHPPRRAKTGTHTLKLEVARERRSSPITQPRPQQQSSNVLVPGTGERRSSSQTHPHPQRQSSQVLIPLTGERRSSPQAQRRPQRQSSQELIPGTGERRSSPQAQPRPQRQSSQVLVPGTGERRSSPQTHPHPQRQSSKVLIPGTGERRSSPQAQRRPQRQSSQELIPGTGERRSSSQAQPHPQRQSSKVLIPGTGERRSSPQTHPHPQRQSSQELIPGTGERRSSPQAQPRPQQQSSHVLVPGTGERRSSSQAQPHPQRQSSKVLVPIRMNKAGLKLVDPARVRSLTAEGAAPPDSGEDRQQSDHQARGSHQRSVDVTHTTISRAAGSWVPHLRNRTGVSGRRQGKHAPVKQRSTSEEESGGPLLTQQVESLALSEGECPECSPSHSCQEPNKPQALPQAATDHSDIRTEEITQVDANCVGAPNSDDQHTPSQGITTLQSTSTIKEEIAVDPSNNKDLSSESVPTEVIQEQPSEGDRGPQTEPCTFRTEDQDTKERGLELECNSVAQSTVDASNNHEGNTKTQSQESRSSHDGLEQSPRNEYVGSMEENRMFVPLEEDNPLQRINMDLTQSSNPAETGPSNSQEGTNPHRSSRNGFIRQSQGVLVLTKSTDENAVFIPKLKFNFTPENSIDWAALPQTFTNYPGVQAKRKDLRFTKTCTPRGPSFSKSLLKKSSASGHGPPAGDALQSAQGSPMAGEFTRVGSPPLYGIVDLSISFQGKYGGEEVPTDIPKILLTDEDNTED